MFGHNPIRKPVKSDGLTLEVQEIVATFQGEGPHTGIPAIFIRLGGCNLACSFCDTEFETFHVLSVSDIVSESERLNTENATLAVITGGEPLRQPLAPLCEALIHAGFRIQIETNGTLYQALPDTVEIICSPKVTAGHYHPIREDMLPRITAFKFIVSASNHAYSTISEIGQSLYHTPVYIQPMDEYDAAKNAANLEYARKLAREHQAKLSLQTHKMAGVA